MRRRGALYRQMLPAGKRVSKKEGSFLHTDISWKERSIVTTHTQVVPGRRFSSQVLANKH